MYAVVSPGKHRTHTDNNNTAHAIGSVFVIHRSNNN